MTLTAVAKLGRVVVVLTVFLCAGCGAFSSGIKGKVVQKTQEPTSDVTALIARAGGNATVGYTFRVYLNMPHNDLAPQMILMASNIIGLRIKWKTMNHLVISLHCGQIYNYRNFLM